MHIRAIGSGLPKQPCNPKDNVAPSLDSSEDVIKKEDAGEIATAFSLSRSNTAIKPREWGECSVSMVVVVVVAATVS